MVTVELSSACVVPSGDAGFWLITMLIGTVGWFAKLTAGTRPAPLMADVAEPTDAPTTFGTFTKTGLVTLTWTEGDVNELPATSVATTRIWCVALGCSVVFQLA